MERRVKILLAAFLIFQFPVLGFFIPYILPEEVLAPIPEDPYARIRDSMLVPGGESRHFEERVDLSSVEYDRMDTTTFEYHCDRMPDFLWFRSDSSITKARQGEYHWLLIGYSVGARDNAVVGNYTFSATYEILDYSTTIPVEVYVVSEIPPMPPQEPWLASSVRSVFIGSGLLFLGALMYLLYVSTVWLKDRLT